MIPKLSSSKKLSSTTTTAIYLLRFNVALQIAVLAIVINLLLAVFTFYFGLNALYCAFGIDCVIGVITSSILVWRFASSRQDSIPNEQNTHVYLLNSYREGHGYSHSDIVCSSLDYFDSSINLDNPDDHVRELWSTFWLGQVMIVSGIGVVIRTVIELVGHVIANEHGNELIVDEMTMMRPLYNLALISLSLNLVLMFFKIFVYYYLGSNSMLIEGVNSFISALFASMAVISIQFSDSVEYLDQIVSIVFGVFLIVYGAFNVLHTIGQTVANLVKKNHSGYDILA